MADTGKTPGPEAVDSDVSFDPAVEWFRKRIGMTQKQVDQMGVDARRKVFYVTGLSDLEAVKAVQDSLAKALERGDTFEDWKSQVKEKGLFGKEFNRRRLETIFRTNMQNAFMAGRYQELTNPAVMRRRPYWRFSAVRDGRTTPVCASAHGTILKADHPWWKTHIPPLHFNCRSTIVPMTEAAAQEAGITEHPTDLSSALGFGNPPYGVPAAARDMPTEEQREKERQASRKAQEAIERRNNASAMHAMDAKAVTKAKNELKEAERRLVSAPPEKRSEAEEDVRRKSEAKDRAVTQERKSASLVERCWRKAEKLSRELKSSSWSLVKGRLGRLKVGVSRGAAEILGELLDAMDEIPLGQEAQAFAFAGDGGGAFGRDFLARKSLLRNGAFEATSESVSVTKKSASRTSPWKKTSTPDVYKIEDVSSGVKEKTFRILDTIPEGALPKIEKGVQKSERVKITPPVGSRHCYPLTLKSFPKAENTVYPKEMQNEVQKDINTIVFGGGKPVEIITTTDSGRVIKTYGFLIERNGTARIYGIKRTLNKWRSYPVAGDGMVSLSRDEYLKLKKHSLEKDVSTADLLAALAEFRRNQNRNEGARK